MPTTSEGGRDVRTAPNFVHDEPASIENVVEESPKPRGFHHRLAYAAGSALAAAILLLAFGAPVLWWGVPAYWWLVGGTFIVALIVYGHID
jgi:hypothetical protein